MLNTCSIGRRWKSREGWSRPVLTGERGTLFPIPLGDWVSSCGGFLVGWQGTLFLVVAMTMLVRRLICLRPLSGSRTATTGIGRVAGFGSAGRRFSGRPYRIGFAVVMAQVRRPVPFRTRKLRPGRGDGTALERVWESSTPPHSHVGGSRRASAPGTPIFVFLPDFSGLHGPPGNAFQARRRCFSVACGRLPFHDTPASHGLSA